MTVFGTDCPPASIGVLGGLGPYAGLDLVQKIFDCCVAVKDQDHLPVMLYSFPHEIPLRVEFLLGSSAENPGYAMGDILVRLARAGATVLGMPCNTAHSPAMLDVALERLVASGFTGRFVHMVIETVEHISATYPHARRIGVLCTQGAFRSRVFDLHFQRVGLETLYPDERGREELQRAISSPEYGIKAFSAPVTEQARAAIVVQAQQLQQRQADIILLGCTELPLVLTGNNFEDIPLVDPTQILARSLVRAFAPKSLRPELSA